jgi:hypothetical protein
MIDALFWDLAAEREWRLVVGIHRQTQFIPEHTRYHNHRVLLESPRERIFGPEDWCLNGIAMYVAPLGGG